MVYFLVFKFLKTVPFQETMHPYYILLFNQSEERVKRESRVSESQYLRDSLGYIIENLSYIQVHT